MTFLTTIASKIVLPILAVILFCLVALATWTSISKVNELQWHKCQVVQVISGNTLVIKMWSKHQIRLAGITAPEGPWAMRSASFLNDIVAGKKCEFATVASKQDLPYWDGNSCPYCGGSGKVPQRGDMSMDPKLVQCEECGGLGEWSGALENDIGVLRILSDYAPIDVNKTMLEEGWDYWDASTSYDKSLKQAEAAAKLAKRGMWK